MRTTRALLAAALFAAAAAPTNAADIRVTIAMRDGSPVPAGTLAVAVNARDADRSSLAQTRERSTGAERTIAVALPALASAGGGNDIVVRLERADGWLLARGSAPLAADVRVTLDAAMY